MRSLANAFEEQARIKSMQVFNIRVKNVLILLSIEAASVMVITAICRVQLCSCVEFVLVRLALRSIAIKMRSSYTLHLSGTVAKTQSTRIICSRRPLLQQL